MEFSQRLAEAAKLVTETWKGKNRVFLDVTEEGITVRIPARSWGDREITKIVSYKEIEQCRINPLTETIRRMLDELSESSVD